MAKSKHRKKSSVRSVTEQRKLLLVRMFSGIVAFLPCIAYILLVMCIFRARSSSFHVLGIVGTFLLGLALFFLVGSIEPEAFGFHIHASKYVSIFLLILSSLCLGVTLLFLFIPRVYLHIQEQIVAIYFLLWGIQFLIVIAYLLFRLNVTACFRREGLSKSYINARKKGKRNYWWYESLHTEHSLRYLYWFNKGFTLAALVTLTLQLLLGWWKPLMPLIACLSAIELACCCIMLMGAGIRSAFSLLSDRKGIERTFLLVFLTFCGFLLCAAIFTLQKTLWLWSR